MSSGDGIPPFPRVSRPLPSGWTRAKLDDVTSRGSGHTPDQGHSEYWNGGIKWVSLADSWRLDRGYVDQTEKQISELGIVKSSAVLHKPGTVILSRDAGVGKSAVLKSAMAVSQHFITWECDAKGILDPWFLYAWLQVQKPFFERMAVGSTIKTIGLPLFRQITLDFPPLPEQRNIARMLRTWDEAIGKLDALLTAHRKLYSYLADELFFGTKRLGQRNAVRRRHRLAEVTCELSLRNNGRALKREFVMGVSNSKGIVPMREQTISADLSRYKILPPRAFAYNPMRINVGSIAMSRLERDVLVSPDYVLFQCTDRALDPDYLDHLCSTHWWSHHINAGGSGSVRMRTYYDDLAALSLELPDFQEQQAISSVLSIAKREIDLIGTQMDALARQKRGLMQKLLTGEWMGSI